MTHKGFTLIELLIVIGIISVLTVAVILTLNPQELLRQSRDASRLSDTQTLNRAIALYLTGVTTPQLALSYTTCYMSQVTTGVAPRCGGRFAATTLMSGTTTALVNGTGWLPINFNQLSSGAPLGNLPLDPVNDTAFGYYYAYAANQTPLTFELNAHMESNKYKSGGAKDVESTDGGDDPALLEIGTDAGLNL
jgi:prepilin-type N-terminal cleavage/methylation domain-containing protein